MSSTDVHPVRFVWAAVLSLAMLPMLRMRADGPAASSPAQSAAAAAPSPRSAATCRPRPEQIVSDGLADADPQIRANAVEVVASTRELRLMPKVQKLLADPVVPVRFAAILAVGDMGYAPAKNEVGPLLNDPNPNIKIAACLCDEPAGPDRNSTRRSATRWPAATRPCGPTPPCCSARAASKEGIRFLYWTLQRDDSSDMVILQAAEAIAMLGDHRIYPKLWTRLISTYADDRVIGIRAMGALGTDEAKSAIITMLDDPVPEVRLAAAEQLGKLGESGGEAEVLAVFEKNLMADMDAQGQQRIKTLAALAIGEIGTERSAKYLPQLLQDPSKARASGRRQGRPAAHGQVERQPQGRRHEYPGA